MMEESDLIIFLMGALFGLLAGYWLRDRQSVHQKLVWRKKHDAPASRKERNPKESN
jgi:hypothetical protein